MARPKEKGMDLFSLMQDFISEASTSVDYKGSLPVVEFAEQIIFNGGAQLFPQQKAILKAFYNEPLTEAEKLILSEWEGEDRSNWVDGRSYRSLSLEAGRGGPLALDTLVKVPEGYKPISKIKIGDTVFNEVEEPITVVDLHGPFYDRELYEITFYSGAKVKCDASHLWPIHKFKKKEINLTTRELLKRKRSLIIKPLGRRLETSIPFIPGSIRNFTKTIKSLKEAEDLEKKLDDLDLSYTKLYDFDPGRENYTIDPYYSIKAAENNWRLVDRIKSIEPIPSEPVMCIEVDDPKHLFLITEKDIPTCNSKSALGSIFALYEFYKLISMPNPARHYGLLPNDPIAIFVIAQTLEQVKDTLFAKIRGYAKDSSFFRSLEDSGKIEILSESIRYPAKNVAIYAKHTNSPALVGYTLKAMILDEFARFENKIEDDGTITSTGEHLYSNVGAGTHRFGAEGYRIAISSAWEPEDPMERMWDTAQKDPEILAFRLRTWDLNKLPSVSREACNGDYIKNREKAELEFEGIRRRHKSNFITSALVESCLKSRSCIDSNEIPIDIQSGNDIRHYVGIEITRCAEPSIETQSFIHLDFSVKRDATALAIASAKKITDIETGDDKWIVSVDGLLRWKPYLDEKGIKRVVSYQNVEDIIIQLCSKRRVAKVTFDQFNSESSIQRLHSLGISTEQLSCSRNAQLNYYTLFRDLASSDNLYLPKDSIYTNLLITEITELIIKPNGQIVHNLAGKDTADAVVNAVYSCYQNMIKSGLALNISVDIATVENKMKRKIADRMPKDSVKRANIGRAINTLHKKIKL